MLLAASCSVVFAQTEKPSKTKKEHSAAKAKYTCPMHPEVVSSQPGKCSQCGTQLVVQRTGSKQLKEVSYTCPMHPDVVSDKAGKCAKCGMTLEKKEGEKSNSKSKI